MQFRVQGEQIKKGKIERKRKVSIKKERKKK
jgi:hypothetical protein